MAATAVLQHAEGLEPRFFQVGWTSVHIGTYRIPAAETPATMNLEQGDPYPEDANYKIVYGIEVAGPGGYRQGSGSKLIEVRAEYNKRWS